ncbi:MAG TPA: GNAT family N-acetyltransferase [Candidatus Rifleibacterium sp.]|nr:GNAT family N-acetyltransferase [Candidatus Rifleibacterium sp.]HPT46567.1 GNAT family N-acetyltransferase [Candidatus Rifleibacterium sp.]
MIDFLRVATSDAIHKTAELAAEIWREHYQPIIGAAQVDYMISNFQSVAAITSQLDKGELIYFLIRYDGIPEGYFAISVRQDEVFLSKLYIRQAMRERGLARKALDFIKGVAAENCLKRISLTVNRNNHLALQSYEKLGFVSHGTAVTDIGGGYVMDDYLLALQLK